MHSSALGRPASWSAARQAEVTWAAAGRSRAAEYVSEMGGGKRRGGGHFVAELFPLLLLLRMNSVSLL